MAQALIRQEFARGAEQRQSKRTPGPESRTPMRSTFRTSSLALLALIVVVPAFASAQTIPSPYEYLEKRQEFGLLGGMMDVNTGRFGYGPDGGPLLGVRYAIELSGPIAFEGVVGHARGNRDVVDPGRVEGDRIIGSTGAAMTMIDARLRFSFVGRRMWHRLSPFLSLGGGLAFDTGASSDLDTVLLPEDVFEFGTSFFGTVGVGNRWFVTETIALRGDATFSLWQLDTPPGYADPARAFESVSDSEWLRGTTFSLSLLYRW